MMTKEKSRQYVEILREELVPAMGCTEPIAVAYGAAKAREALGVLPDTVRVEASGNIIKNVKSVVVPNTGGLKGIPAAAAAGIVAGNAGKVLEVISSVTAEQKRAIRDYLASARFEVLPADTGLIFDVILTLSKGKDAVSLRIANYHTNIVSIRKNGETLYETEIGSPAKTGQTDRSGLNVADILAFADTVDLSLVKDVLERQISYNTAIAEEGLKNSYGAGIGRVLLDSYGNDIRIRARAKAAAGSDARMSGCELPVVIVSGSGNQGITASLPVVEYAKELGASEEKMYRAVLLSDLLTIHLKTGIGRLSAYCGAVSAGCSSGAGIAYLHGGGLEEISHTLVNSLAIVSGIVCDGAKPSCAAKIAAAVDAGMFGYFMYRDGHEFRGGDGIVAEGVENTIANVGRLSREGMSETDREIIRLMTGN